MRESKEPRLSDLRESGAIEQDADLVVFLWREKERGRRGADTDGEVINVKLAKHRNGPTGDIQLWFRKRQTRFQSLCRASATRTSDRSDSRRWRLRGLDCARPRARARLLAAALGLGPLRRPLRDATWLRPGGAAEGGTCRSCHPGPAADALQAALNAGDAESGNLGRGHRARRKPNRGRGGRLDEVRRFDVRPWPGHRTVESVLAEEAPIAIAGSTVARSRSPSRSLGVVASPASFARIWASLPLAASMPSPLMLTAFLTPPASIVKTVVGASAIGRS